MSEEFESELLASLEKLCSGSINDEQFYKRLAVPNQPDEATIKVEEPFGFPTDELDVIRTKRGSLRLRYGDYDDGARVIANLELDVRNLEAGDARLGSLKDITDIPHNSDFDDEYWYGDSTDDWTGFDEDEWEKVLIDMLRTGTRHPRIAWRRSKGYL